MNKGWESLLEILPLWLRREADSRGRESLQEIRLRLGLQAEFILKGERIWLTQPVSQEDISFCINAASRYSPWAAQTSAQGYLTAPGGHRIGLCGEAVMKNGVSTGIKNIRSLCIRVARDITAIAGEIPADAGSILIIGAPGWGKTTLLRDLIRSLSRQETVAVVDERGELFPPGFSCGPQTDILTQCPKETGILQLLKTMGPQTIAVDEITEEKDCRALLHASRCGVRLLATAHAASLADLKQREAYIPFREIFNTVFILRADQTYHAERMAL